MKAFHGKQEIKDEYLNRVKAHSLADEIIKGKYWEDGKGCAVGCTIHSDNHNKYETELDIPEWLARLEDTIFEGLENKRAKEFPLQFLEAIKVGADLDKIKSPFLIYILKQNLIYLDNCKYDEDKNPAVKAAIDVSKKAILGVIKLYQVPFNEEAAWSARAAGAAGAAARAAESAARAAGAAGAAAWSAAGAAARAAESAAGAAAWSAAWSAAGAAGAAARAAESAAGAAAWSAAWSARAAGAAGAAARAAAWAAAAYAKYADKLLELMKDCGQEVGE